MKTLELAPDLRQVVMEALDTPYTSFSSTDESETGNRYQSVEFGDFVTRGLREGRGHFLDVIDFRDKHVLDLGSNLGEISRQVRSRGARLVDGFEYEPYFIEIANLVNVVADTTRVSFFERDISDPRIYTGRYDIVLAFSVMRFIADCLDRLAEITDVVLLEGHTVSGNFEERYMKPLTRWFPAYRVLGDSDSARVQQDDVRPVMLMARDEESLIAALAPHLRAGGRTAGVMAAGSRWRGMRGSVDVLSVEADRVRMQGWCLDPEGPHDLIQLDVPAEGQAVPAKQRAVTAVAAPGERPDVGVAIPHLPHAGACGFEFDYRPPGPMGEHVRLDVSAYRGSQRLGTISAWHLDGMYEAMPAPPATLAARHWGVADPRRLALASLGVVSAMLEAAGRYRRLESFGSLLDWGCGIGLLERYLPRLVPGTEVSGVDWDAEALAWAQESGLPGTFAHVPETPPTGLGAGSYDLVLGHGTLPRVAADRHPEWMAELHRIAAPGGWIVLTLLGELARRFAPEPDPAHRTKAQALALCSERFDVVSYVEGGVAGLYDLIVLRRP
jgi:SAM-dependent methyltransferase